MSDSPADPLAHIGADQPLRAPVAASPRSDLVSVRPGVAPPTSPGWILAAGVLGVLVAALFLIAATSGDGNTGMAVLARMLGLVAGIVTLVGAAGVGCLLALRYHDHVDRRR